MNLGVVLEFLNEDLIEETTWQRNDELCQSKDFCSIKNRMDKIINWKRYF